MSPVLVRSVCAVCTTIAVFSSLELPCRTFHSREFLVVLSLSSSSLLFLEHFPDNPKKIICRPFPFVPLLRNATAGDGPLVGLLPRQWSTLDDLSPRSPDSGYHRYTCSCSSFPPSSRCRTSIIGGFVRSRGPLPFIPSSLSPSFLVWVHGFAAGTTGSGIISSREWFGSHSRVEWFQAERTCSGEPVGAFVIYVRGASIAYPQATRLRRCACSG